jgi:hypothetical protein
MIISGGDNDFGENSLGKLRVAMTAFIQSGRGKKLVKVTGSDSVAWLRFQLGTSLECYHLTNLHIQYLNRVKFNIFMLGAMILRYV